MSKGSFTLPGEAGYEKLTLELAEKWGADVIRDSDGTVLSDEITNAGYGIYSTICIIRDHNEWAKKNLDKLQQSFLMTSPRVADKDSIVIPVMEDFFAEQFAVNSSADALAYWQVYDRTTDTEVARDKWSYDEAKQEVVISGITPWHTYTVSFLAYRIWEEISMYNHTTNNWDKEHLMQIDPVYPETQEYLKNWMTNWCETHPTTTVVRFTSMFYNFVWIWGSSEKNRHLYSDWASYDFTVSPKMLNDFADKYGYRLTAEDFINQGKLHVTHMPGNDKKTDWINFINRFVVDFGQELIDIVHSYGKKAYVFYDDSWVGIEPYKEEFKEFGFDGLIKCVFSGYEVRLCSGVEVGTHELRLHPYLFPVGLGGAPTFSEGGDPTLDAKKYWNSVRRALLRTPIDRIGLGGYLHLVEDFPDFVEYIAKISDEFRTLKELHSAGKPYHCKTKVAVLHYWGSLRSWTLSGHFHETYMHDLIHINEALSGLPIEVSFIGFEDVKNGALKDFDVVINAGAAGSAWSGGDAWKDEAVVEALTKWVYEGGAFIGVDEPSAVAGYDSYFRMAHVLGVDKDVVDRVCHGQWSFDVDNEAAEKIMVNGSYVPERVKCHLTDGKAVVLAAKDNNPLMTVNSFGKGQGIYMSTFEVNNENTRMLLNLILTAGKEATDGNYLTDNANMECAYYPESKTLIIINNSGETQTTSVKTEYGVETVTLEAYDTIIKNL
ncbi:MAG: 1,3-beta-galactosyl-N-acetylhexosamine phosphorylase [Lachnospiraceae bacterium]|nr:1,3-beta-galactosyl-N-acetylhexosamine phosphorylase [Lachnospiraceae bacterium]